MGLITYLHKQMRIKNNIIVIYLNFRLSLSIFLITIINAALNDIFKCSRNGSSYNKVPLNIRQICFCISLLYKGSTKYEKKKILEQRFLVI